VVDVVVTAKVALASACVGVSMPPLGVEQSELNWRQRNTRRAASREGRSVPGMVRAHMLANAPTAEVSLIGESYVIASLPFSHRQHCHNSQDDDKFRVDNALSRVEDPKPGGSPLESVERARYRQACIVQTADRVRKAQAEERMAVRAVITNSVQASGINTHSGDQRSMSVSISPYASCTAQRRRRYRPAFPLPQPDPLRPRAP